MPEERVIGQTKIRLDKDDLTAMETDALVFYAQHDLKLGSGFGTAISGRGGPTIQKELDEKGAIETCEAVVTSAGNMNAKKIIHAVGPRFQELDMEGKLRKTMENTLRLAEEEEEIRTLAFPPMGAGFYGVPLEICAGVMLDAIRDHASGGSRIEQIDIIVMDNREYTPFAARFATLGS
jgi:O-acetyl-ADP-ribose deacetylase (regulator of RNase III)